MDIKTLKSECKKLKDINVEELNEEEAKGVLKDALAVIDELKERYNENNRKVKDFERMLLVQTIFTKEHLRPKIREKIIAELKDIDNS